MLGPHWNGPLAHRKPSDKVPESGTVQQRGECSSRLNLTLVHASVSVVLRKSYLGLHGLSEMEITNTIHKQQDIIRPL